MKKIDNQIPPRGDNRKRTNRSVKLYLAELICGAAGCRFEFIKSEERVVYESYIGGKIIEEVYYKTVPYKLESPERMKKIVAFYLENGVSVKLPVIESHCYDGLERTVESDDFLSIGQDFDAFPFIDITKEEERRSYASIKKFLNDPNYFFNDETWEWEQIKNN